MHDGVHKRQQFLFEVLFHSFLHLKPSSTRPKLKSETVKGKHTTGSTSTVKRLGISGINIFPLWFIVSFGIFPSTNRMNWLSPVDNLWHFLSVCHYLPTSDTTYLSLTLFTYLWYGLPFSDPTWYLWPNPPTSVTIYLSLTLPTMSDPTFLPTFDSLSNL